jgi:hypothetical protein
MCEGALSAPQPSTKALHAFERNKKQIPTEDPIPAEIYIDNQNTGEIEFVESESSIVDNENKTNKQDNSSTKTDKTNEDKTEAKNQDKANDATSKTCDCPAGYVIVQTYKQSYIVQGKVLLDNPTPYSLLGCMKTDHFYKYIKSPKNTLITYLTVYPACGNDIGATNTSRSSYNSKQLVEKSYYPKIDIVDLNDWKKKCANCK